MSEPKRKSLSDMEVDLSNLYREEAYTDLSVASIRALHPIKPDGSPDPSRPPMFLASTTVMTQMGAMPVEGPIEAANLAEAWAEFPKAIQDALDRMVQRAQEYQREESKRIVVPGQNPAPGLGGLGGMGGPAPRGGGGLII
jgi:hypothetical protein